MTKSKQGRYRLEFKQEAARLVESGQSQAAVARSLGEALFRRIFRFANSE